MCFAAGQSQGHIVTRVDCMYLIYIFKNLAVDDSALKTRLYLSCMMPFTYRAERMRCAQQCPGRAGTPVTAAITLAGTVLFRPLVSFLRYSLLHPWLA